MKRWILITCPLIAIFILSSFSFSIFSVEVPDALKVKEPSPFLFPQDKAVFEKINVQPPFLGSKYIGFKEALAFKESQGNYAAVNSFGYMGKYQFGVNTLALVGVRDSIHFLENPALQEEVFEKNIARNKWILRKDIARFVGKRINGIEITESGILAAAHLAGPGNVKQYLRSFGKTDVMDGYGTTIATYLKKFSGYDITLIKPIKNARI